MELSGCQQDGAVTAISRVGGDEYNDKDDRNDIGLQARTLGEVREDNEKCRERGEPKVAETLCFGASSE